MRFEHLLKYSLAFYVPSSINWSLPFAHGSMRASQLLGSAQRLLGGKESVWTQSYLHPQKQLPRFGAAALPGHAVSRTASPTRA